MLTIEAPRDLIAARVVGHFQNGDETRPIVQPDNPSITQWEIRLGTIPTQWSPVLDIGLAFSAQDATQPVVIHVQDTTYTPSGVRLWTKHNLDPRAPARVLVSNVRALYIYRWSLLLDIETEDQAPCDVISVDAYLPEPTNSAMRWDHDRWDRAAYDAATPQPGTLIWDTSTWDTSTWYDPVPTMTWQSILGPGTEITVTRRVAPVLHTARVGTLTLRALSGLDPRAIGLVVGTPVRAYTPHLERIFTGTLISARVTPQPPGSRHAYVTELEFADLVAPIAAITRYGAKNEDDGGREMWWDRVRRVLQSAPDAPTVITDMDYTWTPPTVWETSLAHYLDALVATVGGYWTVTRDGTLTISPTPPPEADPAIFSDSYDQPGMYYTDVSMQWDTSELVSSIESTTHAATLDEDGEWHAADRTITVDAPTVATAWTGRRLSVDLMTELDGDHQEQAARRLLATAQEIPPVQALALSTRRLSVEDATRLASLDPLTPATVHAYGDTYDATIIETVHHITPHQWDTQINFTR